MTEKKARGGPEKEGPPKVITVRGARKPRGEKRVDYEGDEPVNRERGRDLSQKNGKKWNSMEDKRRLRELTGITKWSKRGRRGKRKG